MEGQKISNLRFVDDIDLMGGSNDEQQEFTERLSNSAQAYGMEVSSQYLRATLTKDGRSTMEIKPAWPAKLNNI